MASCQAFYYTKARKGKVREDFFFNYRSGLTLSTHRPVTTKDREKYDSIGDKKKKTCYT